MGVHVDPNGLTIRSMQPSMPPRKSHSRTGKQLLGTQGDPQQQIRASNLSPPSGPPRPPRRLLRVFSAFLFNVLLFIAYLKYNDRMRFAPRDSAQIRENQAKDAYGVYSYDVVNVYNHDPHAFTQGLVHAGNDTLYESTGLYGSSSVRKVHLQTGEVLKLYQMSQKYFGEGLTLLNRRLYQVAWLVTFGFIYEEDTLSSPKIFKHSMKDGWGLATDGHAIYGSDGTSTVYVMQPSSLAVQRRFVVKDQGKEIHFLNELEFVGDELWANVWMKDCIVRISPRDGKVLGWILLHDLRGSLLAQGKKIDVLNGIAWDKEQNKVYVTGKLWPKLYEIKVHPHSEAFDTREDVWKRCKL